ncbi:NPL6 [Candida pseudojiufengensis]|uniref:NPL6 n=1 Tax=Candida pseudojiufengensis TaxID=497109 RepID=UPI002223F3E0|nr:NPL6 [Candida pseudojiufengensis]KAI5964704.1 NPL6 [Candida pseudojiufengensis]
MAKRRKVVRSKDSETKADEEEIEFVEEDTSINDPDVEENDITNKDEEDEYVDDDTELSEPRSRKRKALVLKDDEEDEEEEEFIDEEVEPPEDEDDEEDDDDDETNVDDDGENAEEKRKRGRRRKEKNYVYNENDVFDEDGNPLNTDNDEVRIPNEDPKGKEKIDELGYLKGDREFRIKTFKILGQGDRLYMISTVPARIVGFRDSYLLFKTHRTLFKRVCDNNQKQDLINRGIIPNSYKGRAVNLVTARSIFREFGSKMIKEGKKVIDDFWEQRAIDNGDIPGEYADPDEIYKNKLSNVLGEGINSTNSGIGSGGNATPSAPAPIVNYKTDETWMYQIAQKTCEYNNKLLDLRLQVSQNGFRDIFTNIVHFPTLTQPKKMKIKKFKKENENKNDIYLKYDINYESKNIKRPVTGLASISKDILNEIDDNEIKKAIIDQINYEKEAVL